jgi:prolyl-tRNA synthetase
MFGIEFETEEKARAHAWQNSWGLTTRSIGVMVMTHGDDKGLVVPPRVAQTQVRGPGCRRRRLLRCTQPPRPLRLLKRSRVLQLIPPSLPLHLPTVTTPPTRDSIIPPPQVVVIPIPNSKLGEEAVAAMAARAAEIEAGLRAAGVRVTTDKRDNYTPGWKYNYWELRGVPLRVELGPKDMEAGVAMLARRDTGAKQALPWGELAGAVPKLLEQIQVGRVLVGGGCNDRGWVPGGGARLGANRSR